MPIKGELYGAAATKGDVAGPTIKTSIALDAIISALEKLKQGADISEEIKELKEKSSELDQIFDELTGWEAE